MPRFLTCLSLVLFLFLPSCEQENLGEELKRKKGLLAELAEYNFRGEVGAIGYRSRPELTLDSRKWVEVFMKEEAVVDQVVLVPTIRRDSKKGLQADGFPERFEIIITGENGKQRRIIRDNQQDAFLPRVAPLSIPIEPPVRASSVKVLTYRLGQIGWNEEYFFSLSEVMVFSGEKNVALRQEVSSSDNQTNSKIPISRQASYLTDGHLPYGMDAATGEKSVAYIQGGDVGATQTWMVDLGKKMPIDTIRFHRIELDDTIPQSEAGDYAVPSHLTVYGSKSGNFQENAPLLLEEKIHSIYDIGPIMSYPLSHQEEEVRYLQFRFETDSIEQDYGMNLGVVGFAEIEVLSEGENVVLGKSFQMKSDHQTVRNIAKRSPAALTDGRNYYGDILPQRRWIEELTLRHELEREIPLLEQQVISSYTRQKQAVGVGGTVLLLGILLSWFLSWWLPRQERRKIKDRFAADIHDELGANLHTISFISDRLEEENLSREEILKIKQQIRHVSERTGKAIYHMSRVMEKSELYRGLLDDMKRAAERILGNYGHKFTVEGEDLLDALPKRLQIDLLLFYQECLVNIGRHSDAEEFETVLKLSKKHLSLSVKDYGAYGAGSVPSLPTPPEISPESPPILSKSLQRRAKLLGGKLSMHPSADGGFSVLLKKKNLGAFKK